MAVGECAAFRFLRSTLESTLLLFALFATLFHSAVVVGDDQIQPIEYTDASAFEKAVLNVTNTYRRQHNATHLVWNETLAEFAEKPGESCVFKHTGGPYGENLASGYPNASASVIAWGHEREEYDFKKAEFSHETGHFTQLVWKQTSSVGCSRTYCVGHSGGAPGWYVICEYWPRGNVIGAFRENVQERIKESDEPKAPDQPHVPDEPDKPKEECMQGALCSAAGRMGIEGEWLLVGVWAVAWVIGWI